MCFMMTVSLQAAGFSNPQDGLQPGVSGFLRGSLFEANVSFAVSNDQFTIGRQSLWWGPARSGTTLFFNNAEQTDILCDDHVRLFVMRSAFKQLGPTRALVFIDRLTGSPNMRSSNTFFAVSGIALGNQFFPHAEKVSFKPTQNFEFCPQLFASLQHSEAFTLHLSYRPIGRVRQ